MPVEKLIVEQNTGGSTFQRVPWLGAEVRVSWPVCERARATLGVTLYKGWAVNTALSGPPAPQPGDQSGRCAMIRPWSTASLLSWSRPGRSRAE